LLENLTILGIAMPELSSALGLLLLFSPRIGLVNKLLEPIFGFPIFNITSMGGLIFAVAIGHVASTQLLLGGAIKSMDRSLEDASQVAGVNIMTTLRKITLPVLLPAVVSTMILTISYCLEDFDYPAILAQSGNFQVFSTYLYNAVANQLHVDYSLPASLGIVFIIVTSTAFAVYFLVTRKLFRFVTITGSRSNQTLRRLGKWKWLAFAYCFSIFLLAFILPLGILIYSSFTPYFGSLNFQLNLNHFIYIINLGGAAHLFRNAAFTSIELSAIVSLIGVPLAFVLAYGGLRSGYRGARIFEISAGIPLAFSGIVYSLALFVTFLVAPGFSNFYGTLVPLIIAMTFGAFPTVSRIISGNIVQYGASLEEASRVCGVGFWTTLWKIVIPLVRRSMFNSGFVYFERTMSTVGGVVLLVTPGTTLLMPLLWNLYSSQGAILPSVCAGTLVEVMIMGAILTIFRTSENFVGGKGLTISR
jgi:iron(III) transport system permease protein